MRSASVPPQYATVPDQHEDSSPLTSLCPLLPTPSPPPLPIQVNVPMEVVFAPSSVHDMENTLPPSMQRVAEPIETSAASNSTTLEDQPRHLLNNGFHPQSTRGPSAIQNPTRKKRSSHQGTTVKVPPLAEQAIREWSINHHEL